MLSSLIFASLLATSLTPSEIARHDSKDDCWMIIEDEVYDLSDFIQSHPGGDIIQRGCGKDATWFFNHRDALGSHSQGARSLLPHYRLGALNEEITPPPNGSAHVEPLKMPRLRATKLGHQHTADTGPAHSLALRVGHTLSAQEAIPSGISFQAGYSTQRFDFLISDEQNAGIGSVEVKGRLIDDRHSEDKHFALSALVGTGMAYRASTPVIYAQMVGQYGLLDEKLTLRFNGTTGFSPTQIDDAQFSVGAGFEFKPIPIHGIFATVQSPLSNPSAIIWNAGLSFYTLQHSFTLYAANAPSLHPYAVAGESASAFSIGFSLERAFLLRR